MDREIKVGDLIDLSEQDYKNTFETIRNLQALSDEYHNMTDMYDPEQLESIKRKFNSYMLTFASQYAKIKKFKGSQHVYLDEVRKKIKGEALEILLSEGVKVTSAESIVYKTPYYVDRIKLMENIKEFMIRVELMYERFDTTFNAIVQSYSAARREKESVNK